tara:strand:- start:1796 stop:2779 length:984 start_codon:yes stop_codon:yes gene_type:complete
MLLSIIIPVYNAEKFIERCINSVIEQTNGLLDNVEIIIINDGSTDNSLKKIKKLKKSHPIIKLFEQKNSGVGYTRNFGLNKCEGNYVWFIDADDYIDGAILKTICETLINQAPDIILLGYKTVDLEGNKVSEVHYTDDVLTRDKIINSALYSNTVWSKIMSTDIIKLNKLQFDTNVRTAEDFDFSFRVLYFSKKIVTLKNVNYNYIVNPNSISNIRSTEHLNRLAKDSVIVATNLKLFLDINESKHSGSRIVFMLWLNNYLYGLLFSLFRFKYNIKFIRHIIEELKRHNNYPINIVGMTFKKRLFVTVSNRKTLFLIACRLNRLIKN